MKRAGRWLEMALCMVLAVRGAVARQPADPDYGIDFVTVSAPANSAYHGQDLFGFVTGRGSVSYEYRIGRLEITTAQWLGFINTFSTQSDALAFFGAPGHWGATPDPSYHGPGLRWMLFPGAPDAPMQPVYGISWRDAAMFCNWLQNGQGSSLESLRDGAYDTSTFGFNPDNTFTDQRTHNPGARFWIPTLDEWIKAAHFDPNRYGPGEGGWSEFPNGSDTAPVPGPPGLGETSAGLSLPDFAQFDIPLGAYPNTLSPWGLLDASGATTEWTEETFEEIYGQRRWRFTDGSFPQPGAEVLDEIFQLNGSYGPASHGPAGLRVASSIPSVGSSTVLLFAMVTCMNRERRRRSHLIEKHP